MSGFTFTLPNGKAFEIKGPPGLTKEQAQAIFDQQAKTGALVGFKPGDVLSAATQAANGLVSAQAQVGQALSGITGALGAGIPGAAGAIGQISGALGAAGGALNGALSGITAGLSGAIGPAVLSVTGAVTGAAGQLGSVATQAIGTINKTISGTAVTAPIDVANFAKQVPALTSIANMTQSTVTGVLAQAKNLVQQGADVLSNTKGLGEFGLSISQLETAGILKPGTAAVASATGAVLNSVLKSPAVYTGKDGIKGVDSLLDNVPKQSEIQQSLMSKGLTDLTSLGIPVNVLSSQGVAGVALSAAKSVGLTENLLKNLPVPAESKAAFDSAVRDGAFAVNLTETKVPVVFKAIDIPVPAVNTTNRETLNAASVRVIGNDKIPAPNYSTIVSDTTAIESELRQGYIAIANLGDKTLADLGSVLQKLAVLENQPTVTQAQWNAINAELSTIRTYYNDRRGAVVGSTFSRYDAAPPDVQLALVSIHKQAVNFIQEIIVLTRSIVVRVSALKTKIQGLGL